MAAPAGNAEYYKSRDAQGANSALQWASSPDAGGGVASGVGGSFAVAAPPPSSAPPAAPMGTFATSNNAASASTAARSRVEAHTAVGGAIAEGGRFVNPHGGGAYERDLILELCPPGGLKAEPPDDKLAEFARSIPSLNPDLVCPPLLDALEDGNPWIMRAKALCVIDTILRVAGSAEGSNAYADFFYACVGEIEPLGQHARPAVRNPARRVLAALGVAVAAQGAGSFAIPNGGGHGAATMAVHVPKQADVSSPPSDLLDFGSDDPVPSPAPVQVSSTPPAGDLFGGLMTKAGGSAAAAPSTSAVVDAAPSASIGEADLFACVGGVGSASPSVAPASASNDLFGNMTIKTTGSGTQTAEVPMGLIDSPPAVAPSAPVGSAFGFLNSTPSVPASTTSTVETPVTPPAQQPSPTAPQTFDPLLTMGMAPPNNGAPTNPAQMQAMAYQQNMLMMQQQMQQMQMALAMQQGGGGGGNGAAYMNSPGAPAAVLPPVMKPVMGANYMRQVPGVGAQGNSSFSFLGSDPKKADNHSFDFIKDAMKKG